MGLVLVRSESLENWFSIRTTEPEYRQMVQTGPNSEALWISNRVSDACVEGTMLEMLILSRAILGQTRYESGRCAVDARGADKYDEVLFWSPRNSEMRGVFTFDEATDLAKQIRSMATPEDMGSYKEYVIIYGL